MRLRKMTSGEDAKVVEYQNDLAGRWRRKRRMSLMGGRWWRRRGVVVLVGVEGGYVTARRAEENQGSAAETRPMCRFPRTRLRAADK